ncbi:hypothetical protein AMATHDRAFT_55736, partial [Amanita thiersii Skay4041]
MAETLSGILLVTSSAKGNSLVFWWPPHPVSSPRLSRSRPPDPSWPSFLDNPWRASHSLNTPTPQTSSDYNHADYFWSRPLSTHQLPSDQHTPPKSTGRVTPSKDPSFAPVRSQNHDIHDLMFGYSPEYLANLLCPQPPMCHQRFELIVDDLAFLGHPVCAEPDGVWRFKSEKNSSSSSGRDSRGSHSPRKHDVTGYASPDVFSPHEKASTPKSTWLQTFHVVFVLDLPDPSSSASGNVSRYFDIIYEQFAFVITAVLFQEQVLSNFVEVQCDLLGRLKESCVSKNELLSNYFAQALEQSCIGPAIKALYEAIKTLSAAHVTINDIPLELQLPPYLDQLLHNQEEDDIDFLPSPDDDENSNWGQDMRFGWRLPSLTPWKSLLLLDGQDASESYLRSGQIYVPTQDRSLIEGLIRFMKTVNITLSLADIASLLDWDLESQIYPTVRWLVQYHRAKVVDVVHPGLKTIFTLPPKFHQSLSQLAVEFESQFSQPSIPSLPKILAAISKAATSKTDSHFFASVVKSKEHIPMYYDVIHWMLKRDLLITLHLRIRLVATQELKARVRQRREEAFVNRKFHRNKGNSPNSQHRLEELDLDTTYMTAQSLSNFPWLSLSPKSARRYTRRLSSTEAKQIALSGITSQEDYEWYNGRYQAYATFEEEEECESSLDENSGWESSEDSLSPSIIEDPGRATPLQRRWLSSMSEGKDPLVAKRFAVLNQYFDGKKTDDEILYRAEISRKQLREVLHHYEEYVQTFLHPS